MARRKRCAICQELIDGGDAYLGEACTAYEGEILCELCFYEADLCASVVYGRDSEDCPRAITSTRNDTEGEFTCRWVSTDPWRGYYTVSSETWVRIHDDCSLAYSRDSESLARFDELLREMLDTHRIRWARVICMTSNVFSAGYELWIPNESQADYDRLIAQAKEAAEAQYRDPWAFAQTALTGKDPEDCDDRDRLFALVGSMLIAGSR